MQRREQHLGPCCPFLLRVPKKNTVAALEGGVGLSWQSACLARRKTWVRYPAMLALGMLFHVCHLALGKC